MKEERKGYDWVDTGNGNGFWVKQSKRANLNKLPFFCPNEECKRPTSTIDDEYMMEYGICKTCYVMNVEDRQTPLINVDFYKNRLKERGF